MAYVYEGHKWGSSNSLGTAGGTVTFSFVAGATMGQYYSFTGGLNSTYQAVIVDALGEWSSYGNIDFAQTSDSASVDIRFGWDYIDGAGGTLAETVYSWNANGTLNWVEVVFDTSENWAPTTAETGMGEYSFEAVALHEIGHALGLDHNNSSNSIMYAYYGGSTVLTSNDTGGIQSIYGAASNPDTQYYFYAVNTNGDYYFGLTIADTGTYAEGSYYSAPAYDDAGGHWQYYVYDSYDYGYDTGYQGYSAVNTAYYYYDADAGHGPAAYTSSGAMGGIGSEYGTLTATGEYFGYYGHYEADYHTDTIYSYYAINTNGDFYYGYTIADTGTYAEGGYYGATVYDDAGGYWYYYVYDSYDYGYETTYEGYSAVNTTYYYYDAEAGGYAAYSAVAGSDGIGSEYGALSATGEYFGYYGHYEADYYTDTIYSFLATNTSGDYYYGYAIADTGTYAEGSTYGAPYSDDDGGYWTYYVYDSQNYGYETTYEGYSAIVTGNGYYDSSYGSSSSVTAYAGSHGIGSEYGVAVFGGQYDDAFGYYGLYEADYFD